MIEGKSKTIELDEEFYPSSLLKRAIADFSEFLSAELTTDGTLAQLQIRLVDKYAENASTVIHELLNYALDLALKAHFENAGLERDD